MDKKSGKAKSDSDGNPVIKATKELGANERRDQKMKERAALAKEQAAATSKSKGSEVSDV
jgi:hypothetical protein